MYHELKCPYCDKPLWKAPWNMIYEEKSIGDGLLRKYKCGMCGQHFETIRFFHGQMYMSHVVLRRDKPFMWVKSIEHG